MVSPDPHSPSARRPATTPITTPKVTALATKATPTPSVASKVIQSSQSSPNDLSSSSNNNNKEASSSSTNSKKRSLVSGATTTTPPSAKTTKGDIDEVAASPTKRRRCEVTIQRDIDNKKKIPAPPTCGPPEPTKYLKVLFLGPAAQGKTQWMGVPPKTNSSSPSSSSSFVVDYSSKDYSFESSSSVQETVRLQMYNVDCSVSEEPPTSWKYSLLPAIQHVVLVLDLFVVENAEQTLQDWKKWIERHIPLDMNYNKKNVVGCSSSAPVVSLVLINSSNSRQDHDSEDDDKNSKPEVVPSEWLRLGVMVDKVCHTQNDDSSTKKMIWNKWYLVENEASASDSIVQTLIERTWSAMAVAGGSLPQTQPTAALQQVPEISTLTTSKAVGVGH